MTWHGSGPSGYFITPNYGPDGGRVDWEILQGDASGLIDSVVVVGINGIPLSIYETPASGDSLRFNGEYWYFAPAASVSGTTIPHDLLSSTHSDTDEATPVQGDIVAGSGSPAVWARIPVGQEGYVLSVNSNGQVEWIAPRSSSQVVATGSHIALDETSYKVIINGMSGNPSTVYLPPTPYVGQEVLIKDGAGNASTNNIYLIPDGVTIDGMSNFIMSNNYQAIGITYTGTEWSII